MPPSQNTGMHGGWRCRGIRRSGRSRWIDTSPAFNHTLQQPTTRGEGEKGPSQHKHRQEMQQHARPGTLSLRKRPDRQAAAIARKGGETQEGRAMERERAARGRRKGGPRRRKGTGCRKGGRQHALAGQQHRHSRGQQPEDQDCGSPQGPTIVGRASAARGIHQPATGPLALLLVGPASRAQVQTITL